MPWGLQATALLVATAGTAAALIAALALRRGGRGAPAAPDDVPLLLTIPDLSAAADPGRAGAARAAMAGRWSLARSLAASGTRPEEIATRLGIPAGRVEAVLGLIEAFPPSPDRADHSSPPHPVASATTTDRP
jgi:hypothetical protein